MADPVTLGFGMASILGGALLSKAVGSNGQPNLAAPAPAAIPPDPSTPATVPGSKPAQKNSQQQSFLSGAAALQGAGGGMNTGSSGGKSLLGQ